MFGITYILARDGFSGKIVGYTIMPVKNNERVYNEVYRQATIEHGLFDEVRVDHGREFYLTLFIHEKLRECRGNQDVVPYRQTPSTQNHVVERMWVEVNQRISYPIKRVLIHVTETNAISLQSEACKFCVQHIASNVVRVGLDRFVQSWNSHYIPNRGIPNSLASQRTGTTLIHPVEIPSKEDAVRSYREQGGRLRDPHPFAVDPLSGHPNLQEERDHIFTQTVPFGFDFDLIFNKLMTGQSSYLSTAISTLVNCTDQLLQRVQSGSESDS